MVGVNAMSFTQRPGPGADLLRITQLGIHSIKFLKKQEKAQISYSSLHLKELEKENKQSLI